MAQHRAPDDTPEAEPNVAGWGRHRQDPMGFPIGEPHRNMNSDDIASLTEDDGDGERYNRSF
jgi:hypothetical protein